MEHKKVAEIDGRSRYLTMLEPKSIAAAIVGKALQEEPIDGFELVYSDCPLLMLATDLEDAKSYVLESLKELI